jgi:hypothetical protein
VQKLRLQVRIPKTEYHLLFDDSDASSRVFDLLALNSVPGFQSVPQQSNPARRCGGGWCRLSVGRLPPGNMQRLNSGILNCQDPLNRYGRDLIVDDDVKTQARRLFCQLRRPISLICKSTKRFSESLTEP